MTKRHFSSIVTVTLMLLLSAGQFPLLCLASAGSTRRPALPPAPPISKRAKQDRVEAPRPAGESTTILPDGRTLLLGGESPDGPLTNVEIRDSRSGAITRVATGLESARAWHTATVLPDGLVLIFGGIGSKGEVLDSAELFDPENQSFKAVAPTGLTGRAYHTATLLSDGRLVIIGGVDGKGRLLKTLETWDLDRNAVNISKARLQSGRRKATVSLQADGTLLLTGGVDEREAAASGSEIYDSASDSIFWSPETKGVQESGVRLMFSSPADGEAEVDSKIRLSLRFSKRLKPETASRETVSLSGPRGEVPARIVSAEAGRLLFITPLAALAGDTSYNLKVDGPTDPDGQKLEFTAINFKTKADLNCGGGPCNSTPQIIDADTWIPSANNFKGSWTSGRTNATTEDLPPLQAPAGDTALAGRVLALSGNPLAKVTLQVDQQTAITDSTGRFLLTGLQAGRRVLTIQGHTASRAGKKYGTFDVLVDVAAGKTTVLPYRIWLPVLDEQNAVALPIPTNREIGVTTQRVPGMEVRVPAASVLRMPAGAHHSHGLTRRELTSMAITPIPADRPPFPLPQGINDGLLFTLQLHGAHIEGLNGEKRPGLRIVYPNYLNLPAGDRVDFWNYEPAGSGWYMYGHGTVTPDRRQVIPDPGVELQSMYCISLMNKGDAPGTGPTEEGREAGEPVDLGTGLFIYNKADLVLPDVIPIELSRTYRQNDSVERSFGKGMTNPYDMYIFGNTANYGEIILPDGGRIHFDNIQQGPYLYECTNSPTRFYKATMRQITGVGPNGAWEVKLTDGTIYQFGIKVLFGDIFGPHQTITGLSVIQDRFGNKLTVTRDESFRMSRVTSPNGRWIQFSYSDTSKRIATATDNTGRTVGYTYDAGGRLWKVTDAKGGITEYLYDSSDRMLTIKDPRNTVYLTNEYDPASGRITRQTMPENAVYQFAYTVDSQGKITQTEVTDPRNHVHRTTFNASGYPLNDVFAVGTPQQQTYTYERQAGSNLLLSTIDPLGRQTTLGYNNVGKLTSVTKLAGTQNPVTSTIDYEPTFNQIASVTDALSHTVSFSYDTSGRLVTRTDPLNHPTTLTYNSAGQVLTVTDALEHTTQYTYDSGDLVAITDPLNRTTTRYFDGAGRLTRETSPLGAVARFEFDALSLPTRGIDPAQGTFDFAYDANGNLISVTDPRNSITSYTYDGMDRMTKRRDPVLNDVSYQYDGVGNLTQLTDRKNQITQYTYDALNRLTLITYSDNSTTSYAYDAVNRITQIVDSISGVLTYGYDDLDRLTSEVTPQGSVSYTYDNVGRRTSMSVAGQPTVNYNYDNANRLIQITQGTATVTIAYDDADRRTSLTLPDNLVTEYGYDAASQLTALTYKQGGNVVGNLTYEYDAAGRRTQVGGTFARSINPQTVSSANYNSANRQLAFGSLTLSYDLNGSLLNDGENTYTWDARNRLASISGPSLNASFQYDAAGRRTSKTINGTTTTFVYDGANVVQEQSAQTGNANLLNAGLDEMLQRADSAGAWNPFVDGLGSTVSLRKSGGTLQTDYSYDPFGLTGLSGDISDNSSQYTGRENDDIDLYFYRARYYSPTLKRFISEDPIGLAGGPNWYAYVQNQVPNAKDPYGKDLFGVVGGGSAGAAVGGLGVMGTAGYMIGMNTNCKCRDFLSMGGAGTVGVAAGNGYSYPASDEPSGGLGATAGAGGGLFWSNAPSYEALQGPFQTTIISTPWGVGVEIDKSGDIYIASITFGKGWGAGILHFTTNTPKWSTWDTKCSRHHPILV